MRWSKNNISQCGEQKEWLKYQRLEIVEFDGGVTYHFLPDSAVFGARQYNDLSFCLVNWLVEQCGRRMRCSKDNVSQSGDLVFVLEDAHTHPALHEFELFVLLSLFTVFSCLSIEPILSESFL